MWIYMNVERDHEREREIRERERERERESRAVRKLWREALPTLHLNPYTLNLEENTTQSASRCESSKCALQNVRFFWMCLVLKPKAKIFWRLAEKTALRFET